MESLCIPLKKTRKSKMQVTCKSKTPKHIGTQRFHSVSKTACRGFKSFCPCQKQGIAFAIPCFLLCKRVVLSEARGACRASPPKRRRWRIQRGGDGAAVKIACRSKAKAILGTARGLAKQVQVLEAPAKKKDTAFAVSFFFVCSKTCASRHAERAGHRRRSAAGGGYSEAVMAQRSKTLFVPHHSIIDV